MRNFGSILFFIGFLGLLYFLFAFDQSVKSAVVDSGRLSNLGLMADRVCGCIGSAAFLIAGSVLVAASPSPKQTTKETASGPILNPDYYHCPFCLKPIPKSSITCGYCGKQVREEKGPVSERDAAIRTLRGD